MIKRLASCSCGQLIAEASGEPIRVSVCHCLACQRRTGSVFGAQARFARAAVKTAGIGTEYTRVGVEGTKITFTFCSTCGATVFYTMAGQEDIVAVPVGAFADPSFPAPSRSVYEARKHSWVQVPPNAERIG
jgi:hypothetical protein